MRRSTIRTAIGAVVVVVVAGGLWTGFHQDDEPAPHEWAPIQPLDLPARLADQPRILDRVLSLADFSGVSLDGRRVDAHALVEKYPVVLLTYVAEWCENCRYEAPHLGELYWKYARRGFRIVARSEYSHPDVMRRVAGGFGSPYPIVPGSRNPDPNDEDAVRTTTFHYRLRKALGDSRKWGTPFNLVVVNGDVEHPWVVMGEFVPDEMDAFLDAHLPGASTAEAADREGGASGSASE